MSHISTRHPLLTTVAWCLTVVLSGTAVLGLSARAVAQNLASKAPSSLTAQAVLATPSDTQTTTPAHAGEMLAHTCAACHGTQGRLGDESFMPLAGMPTEQFVNTMLAFREGKRPATLMGHVARGFSDDELRAMGVYFAGIAPQKDQP